MATAFGTAEIDAAHLDATNLLCGLRGIWYAEVKWTTSNANNTELKPKDFLRQATNIKTNAKHSTRTN